MREKVRAAVYIRLSKEDGGDRESNSVSNQRELIYSFLKTKPEIEICSERVDDGYSGVTFERPAVRAMLQDIEKGVIQCVIVKDLSRFGRNYIETGRYIEQIFPRLGVRFIAVNDGYDSAAEQNQADRMLLPFRNLMNDAYCRDISLKVRSQMQVRRSNGDYIGAFPAYGYVRSESDRHRLEIDKCVASSVRDIFRWKLEGYSNEWIAARLNAAGRLSPFEYKKRQGMAFFTSFQKNPEAKWSAQAVGRILKNEIYTGTLVQGKESSPNYKIKKKFRKPEAEWIRVENTHEAIISKEEFERVNQLLKEDTRIAPGREAAYPFSGLLKCGGCGKNMIRKIVKTNGKDYVYYICRTNKADRLQCGNAHRIGETQMTACVETILHKQFEAAGEADKLEEWRNTGEERHALLHILMEKIVVLDKRHIRIFFRYRDGGGDWDGQNEQK